MQDNFSKLAQEKNKLKNTIINKNNSTVNFNFNFNLNVYNNNYIGNSNLINNQNSITFNDSNETTLTNILCTRSGLHEIKFFFENNIYANDYITNIILLLNKEHGLYTVFCNIYGNYFIQDLIRKMNATQIQLLLDLIFIDFVSIAENDSGTHCLQELLNHISTTKMKNTILNSIKKRETEMVYDKNATYVFQKILVIIEDTKRIELNNIIIKNIFEFSLQPNSIYVLKNFIATTTIIRNKKKIIEIFSEYCIQISQNPFGNYAIQYLIEKWSIKDCGILIKQIIKKANILACNRYSANVVNKALDFFDESNKNKLINRLCLNKNILYLLNNKYGCCLLYKTINYMSKEKIKELETTYDDECKNISVEEYLKLKEFILCMKLKKDEK